MKTSQNMHSISVGASTGAQGGFFWSPVLVPLSSVWIFPAAYVYGRCTSERADRAVIFIRLSSFPASLPSSAFYFSCRLSPLLVHCTHLMHCRVFYGLRVNYESISCRVKSFFNLVLWVFHRRGCTKKVLTVDLRALPYSLILLLRVLLSASVVIFFVVLVLLLLVLLLLPPFP
jgi:hypothetical protein